MLPGAIFGRDVAQEPSYNVQCFPVGNVPVQLVMASDAEASFLERAVVRLDEIVCFSAEPFSFNAAMSFARWAHGVLAILGGTYSLLRFAVDGRAVTLIRFSR